MVDKVGKGLIEDGGIEKINHMAAHFTRSHCFDDADLGDFYLSRRAGVEDFICNLVKTRKQKLASPPLQDPFQDGRQGPFKKKSISLFLISETLGRSDVKVSSNSVRTAIQQ